MMVGPTTITKENSIGVILNRRRINVYNRPTNAYVTNRVPLSRPIGLHKTISCMVINGVDLIV